MPEYRLLLFTNEDTYSEYVVIQSDFTERIDDYRRPGLKLSAVEEFTCGNLSRFPLDVELEAK